MKLLFVIFSSVLFQFNSLFAQKSAPNIICILVDDLGYGDLACQGAKDMRTPNIDKFAAGGMRLTNFYANCTVCSPSRASLLTGCYPDKVGVPGVIRQNEENNWGYLDPNAVLLPSVLKTKGYQSAIIGKWHLGLESPNTPIERGFDFFKGFLGDMMDDYWNHRRGGINWMRENKTEIDPEGHATDLFTNWAIEYLESRKKNEPFYLYLAYNAPHFPIQPPEEWLAKVKVREPQLSEKRARNVAFIEHLDDAIGKVLASLKTTGLDENTIIVFTSDNGGALWYEQSNGELRGGKQDMYEGGIKVPAYVQWKGKINAGTESDAVSMHMDLFNTFTDVAGAKIEKEVDGRSLLPILLGQETKREERFIYWMRREGGMYGGQSYYAARYGDYKILQNTPFESIQFFNTKDDPLEQNALSNEHNITYDMLRKNLQSHIQEAGKIPWQQNE